MKKSKPKSYAQQLSPWCLLRLFPNRKPILVGRFRSYNDAEGYLQTLRGLIPNVSYAHCIRSRRSTTTHFRRLREILAAEKRLD